MAFQDRGILETRVVSVPIRDSCVIKHIDEYMILSYFETVLVNMMR